MFWVLCEGISGEKDKLELEEFHEEILKREDELRVKEVKSVRKFILINLLASMF